jgi:hypothetical protein
MECRQAVKKQEIFKDIKTYRKGVPFWCSCGSGKMLSLAGLLQAAGIINVSSTLDAANTALNTASAVVTLTGAGSSVIAKAKEHKATKDILPEVDYASLPDELVPLYEQLDRYCQEHKEEFTGGFSFSEDQKSRMTEKLLQDNPGFRNRSSEVQGILKDFYKSLEKAID